jgi:hypothetical protein
MPQTPIDYDQIALKLYNYGASSNAHLAREKIKRTLRSLVDQAVKEEREACIDVVNARRVKIGTEANEAYDRDEWDLYDALTHDSAVLNICQGELAKRNLPQPTPPTTEEVKNG